jgi:hypothetical protein
MAERTTSQLKRNSNTCSQSVSGQLLLLLLLLLFLLLMLLLSLLLLLLLFLFFVCCCLLLRTAFTRLLQHITSKSANGDNNNINNNNIHNNNIHNNKAEQTACAAPRRQPPLPPPSCAISKPPTDRPRPVVCGCCCRYCCCCGCCCREAEELWHSSWEVTSNLLKQAYLLRSDGFLLRALGCALLTILACPATTWAESAHCTLRVCPDVCLCCLRCSPPSSVLLLQILRPEKHHLYDYWKAPSVKDWLNVPPYSYEPSA